MLRKEFYENVTKKPQLPEIVETLAKRVQEQGLKQVFTELEGAVLAQLFLNTFENQAEVANACRISRHGLIEKRRKHGFPMRITEEGFDT